MTSDELKDALAEAKGGMEDNFHDHVQGGADALELIGLAEAMMALDLLLARWGSVEPYAEDGELAVVDVTSRAQNRFVQDWLTAYMNAHPNEERDVDAYENVIELVQETYGESAT